MIRLALLALALVLSPAVASADDSRDRKARAALALARANPAATVAPAPREAKAKCYAAGHKEATEGDLPLVVYVGCDCRLVEGAVVCAWESYPGVKGPAVVVGYPVGGRIVQDAVLPASASAAEVKRAAESARKKTADVKVMPTKVLPMPLDWTKITADVPEAAASPGSCVPGDGLDEVNAKRAARGLRAFIRDEGLTQAARGAAEYRAHYQMFGHITAGAGDFAFLPAGVRADAAGCAAYPAHYGWLSCCINENASHAGAAWVMGTDGLRYMHLFVRNSPPALEAAPVVVAAPVVAAPVAAPRYVWEQRCTVRNGRRSCEWVLVAVP